MTVERALGMTGQYGDAALFLVGILDIALVFLFIAFVGLNLFPIRVYQLVLGYDGASQTWIA